MEKKLSPPEKERFVVFEQGDKGTSKGIRLCRTYGKFCYGKVPLRSFYPKKVFRRVRHSILQM